MKSHVKVQPVWKNKRMWPSVFKHNSSRVTEFRVAKSRSDLGACDAPGFSAESTDIAMDTVCERPRWPERVRGWSVRGPAWSVMTDELAVDLGGLGDSLSACDSRGAPCALTPPSRCDWVHNPEPFLPSIYDSQINKWQNHEIPSSQCTVAVTVWDTSTPVQIRLSVIVFLYLFYFTWHTLLHTCGSVRLMLSTGRQMSCSLNCETRRSS